MSTPSPRRARLKPDPHAAARRAAFADDVERLVAALRTAGIAVSPDDAYSAWRRHSDSYAAGWLQLYDDDAANREALLRYLELEE